MIHPKSCIKFSDNFYLFSGSLREIRDLYIHIGGDVMGDPRRFEIFSKNIYYKYPPEKYPTVLVIADGNLELSKCLYQYGYSVTVFEPKPRLQNVSQLFLKKVTLIRKWFTKEEKIKSSSLIVGMHPDEATVEIIQYAKINNIPFAVVPCCILGDKRFTINCHRYSDWIDRLMRIIQGTEREVLGINGKSTMIFKR